IVQSTGPPLLSQGTVDAGGTVPGWVGFTRGRQPRCLDRAVLSLLRLQPGPCGEVVGLRPGGKPAGLQEFRALAPIRLATHDERNGIERVGNRRVGTGTAYETGRCKQRSGSVDADLAIALSKE